LAKRSSTVLETDTQALRGSEVSAIASIEKQNFENDFVGIAYTAINNLEDTMTTSQSYRIILSFPFPR